VDLGNIYDRRFEFDYVSSVHSFSDGRPASLTWKAQTPLGSRVRLQIRTAESEGELDGAAWRGPGGPATFFEHPAEIPDTDPSHAVIQYRATLHPAPTGVVSPTLEEVVVLFR
jgi:hypothetical protein